MAAGPITQIADVVVPEIFSPYRQQITEEKSALISSGALIRNAEMDSRLAGGGLTFTAPSWDDLDNDADRVSTDTADIDFSGGTTPPDPAKIESLSEIMVRLSRNQSWSASRLSAALAGSDPMTAVADRVGAYWARRLQVAFIATWTGVFADNTANDSGDYTNNVSAASYAKGVTDFSAEVFTDTLITLGDSLHDLSMIMVHSGVYGRMLKNNLIDFVTDSTNPDATRISVFQGHRIVIDDGMPVNGSVYESWLFGAGATEFGVGSPAGPSTEVQRYPGAGNGGGQDVLYDRVEWSLHPRGHAFVAASPANGGPTNAATTNNLGAAASWNRVFTERKQIKVARLITREA